MYPPTRPIPNPMMMRYTTTGAWLVQSCSAEEALGRGQRTAEASKHPEHSGPHLWIQSRTCPFNQHFDSYSADERHNRASIRWPAASYCKYAAKWEIAEILQVVD